MVRKCAERRLRPTAHRHTEPVAEGRLRAESGHPRPPIDAVDQILQTRATCAPTRGVSSGLAARDAIVEPIQHFAFHPSDPVRPEVYLFGERSDFLRPRDMLWRVQDQFPKLVL